MQARKILFIIKKANNYSDKCYGNYGLFNSAKFVANKLNALGIDAQTIEVVDNNAIERAVVDYDASHIILEALWVVPEKVELLAKRHPNRKWVIRLHSKIPFLSNEGVAMDWLYKYTEIAKMQKNVYISFNSEEARKGMGYVNIPSALLPNIYYPNYTFDFNYYDFDHKKKNNIDIGCFGAIRPMKNQLIQAVAAIKYANDLKRVMFFHINGTRNEQDGFNVLKNIRALFANNKKHKLIEYQWIDHKQFVHNIIPRMDLGLQVSFSESFNIVTADFVSTFTPIVVSSDVDWMSKQSQAAANSVDDIVDKMHIARKRNIFLPLINHYYLLRYNKLATDMWVDFLRK